MGLDWVLEKHKARPGFEERYATVSRHLDQMEKAGVDSQDLKEEFAEVSVSPYEAVGAPQVGIDPEATEWFREHVYEPARADAEAGNRNKEFQEYWMRGFDACLEANKGNYVMELARDKGGIAAISGIAVSSVDFRGKVLRSVEGLDPTLVDESYQDHTAEECVAYANRLEAQMPQLTGNADKKTLQGAISWLRFWGEKGFGYWAWY